MPVTLTGTNVGKNKTLYHLLEVMISERSFLRSRASSPQDPNTEGHKMNQDVRTITKILDAEGVFDEARLLDPEAIVNVALNLAETPNPNDFMAWLTFYAARYGVTVSNLAIDALIVLSYSAEFVGARIANAAEAQARQLRLRELVSAVAA